MLDGNIAHYGRDRFYAHAGPEHAEQQGSDVVAGRVGIDDQAEVRIHGWVRSFLSVDRVVLVVHLVYGVLSNRFKRRRLSGQPVVRLFPA
ncbi:hypothetical protein BN871_AA_00230 [Paenibacillus sp. P22]|nr:hypothetical protein BN871_AA_00230 [Paenibacillus sp. P22]